MYGFEQQLRSLRKSLDVGGEAKGKVEAKTPRSLSWTGGGVLLAFAEFGDTWESGCVCLCDVRFAHPERCPSGCDFFQVSRGLPWQSQERHHSDTWCDYFCCSLGLFGSKERHSHKPAQGEGGIVRMQRASWAPLLTGKL